MEDTPDISAISLPVASRESVPVEVEDSGRSHSISSAVVESGPDVFTIDAFREQVYLDHPGIQFVYIFSRENFLEQILGVYKSRDFNLLQKPKVQFCGEAGKTLSAKLK